MLNSDQLTSRAHELARRWRGEWDGRTDLARLGREFRKILQFLEQVPSTRAALAVEGKLSRKGLDEAVRDQFASMVVPDLRRAAHTAEGTINAVAARRAHLLRVEFDKTNVAGALMRRELRDHLRSMTDGERVTAFTQSKQFREAACEGPALLSGFSEDMRSELKRRVALEEHPQEAAYLAECEEAVRVVDAAITMVGHALQSAAGFEGDDQAFERWITASSAGVEREIEAERSRANTSTMPASPDADQLMAEIKRDIDRIFHEGLPALFGPPA